MDKPLILLQKSLGLLEELLKELLNNPIIETL